MALAWLFNTGFTVINLIFLQAEDPSLKDSAMVQAIVSNVVQRCGCAFAENQITERGFQCFPSSPQAVTYRARLHETSDATVPDLLQYIEEWIQDGATISVQFQRYSLDTTCDVRVDSFTESECGIDSASDSASVTGVIVGAVVGMVLVLVIVTAIVVVVMMVLVRRKSKRQVSRNLIDTK